MLPLGAHRGARRTSLVLLQLIVFVTYIFGATATLAEEPAPEEAPPSGPADQAPGTPDVENESRTATFEFSSDQVGSTFECRLTGEATGTTWQTCTSAR